ncbi:hypothetical protein [Saccharibacter floricola]|nr:hypothetical protein [Saccharibacter floricola]
MPQIVTINESIIRGAAPNLLQQKGLLVSLGGTNTAAGTLSFLSEPADLTALLPTTTASSASSSSASPSTSPVSSSSSTSSGSSTASSPLPSTTSAPSPTVELQAMAASWFANSTAGVWVLELGTTKTIADDLKAFLEKHPQSFYGVVLPRGVLAIDPNLPAFLANQGSNNTRLYAFLCGTKDDAKTLTANSSKAVFYGAEHSTANLTQEHLASAVCAQFLSARPGPVNRLAPMNFRFLTGITPWPEAGNGPAFAAMKEANISFPGTAREGGVSGTILFWGNFLNGDPMSEWYGADWAAINLELQLANLIIEDSQPGIRPLIYDQNGIDRLTARAEQTLGGGEAAGCIVSYSLTATSFAAYVSQNPSAYQSGDYSGVAATIATPRGFLSLTFNLAVDFSGQSVVAAVSSTASSTGA